MEANTVLLSVKEYNELRDFKKDINDGHSYRVRDNGRSFFNCFVTKNETVVELLETNKSLSEKILLLEKPNSLLIAKIKQMSFWQLFKYWIKGCKESSLF